MTDPKSLSELYGQEKFQEPSYLHGPNLTPKQGYYIGSGDLPLKVLIMLSEAYSDVQETDRSISGIHPRTKRFERVT